MPQESDEDESKQNKKIKPSERPMAYLIGYDSPVEAQKATEYMSGRELLNQVIMIENLSLANKQLDYLPKLPKPPMKEQKDQISPLAHLSPFEISQKYEIMYLAELGDLLREESKGGNDMDEINERIKELTGDFVRFISKKPEVVFAKFLNSGSTLEELQRIFESFETLQERIKSFESGVEEAATAIPASDNFERPMFLWRGNIGVKRPMRGGRGGLWTIPLPPGPILPSPVISLPTVLGKVEDYQVGGLALLKDLKTCKDKLTAKGTFIYYYVLNLLGENLAPKVTGMIIDLPDEEFEKILASHDVLKEKTKEAT